jgi:hypothetical protein
MIRIISIFLFSSIPNIGNDLNTAYGEKNSPVPVPGKATTAGDKAIKISRKKSKKAAEHIASGIFCHWRIFIWGCLCLGAVSALRYEEERIL